MTIDYPVTLTNNPLFDKSDLRILWFFQNKSKNFTRNLRPRIISADNPTQPENTGEQVRLPQKIHKALANKRRIW
jgi:hypothetical protein